MREKYKTQMPLMSSVVDHPHAKELEEIDRILDAKPNIIELAYQDITRGGKKSFLGAKGIALNRSSVLLSLNR